MRWVWPPDKFFVERSIPKLQHVPLLIEEGVYPIEANRYVEERSLGEWAPDMESDEDDPTVLTKKSRANLASRLCAFFFWLNQDQQRDWRTLDYAGVLNYQHGLQLGTGNATGRQLEPGSINAYVDEACSFLKWAAVRGLRDRFKVPRRQKRVRGSSSGSHARSYRRKLSPVRQGLLQVPGNGPMTLPEAKEVERWMAVLRRLQPVKALEFELMIRTGARISEAHHLSLSCFPRKCTWTNAQIRMAWVPLILRYGVKGPKSSPGEMLSTKSRLLEVLNRPGFPGGSKP